MVRFRSFIGLLQQEVHSNTHQYSYITNKYTSSRKHLYQALDPRPTSCTHRVYFSHRQPKALSLAGQLLYSKVSVIYRPFTVGSTHSNTHQHLRYSVTTYTSSMKHLYQALDSNQHSYISIEYTLAVENQKLYHQQGGFLG